MNYLQAIEATRAKRRAERELLLDERETALEILRDFVRMELGHLSMPVEAAKTASCPFCHALWAHKGREACPLLRAVALVGEST